MGCFSFLCLECGKGILSNSFKGERVKLFYLRDNKVIEQIEGEYDSYGGVFIDGTQCADVKHPLRQRRMWEHQEDISESTESFFYGGNRSWGIAAIHSRCFTGMLPTCCSENDPDQGWGDSGELMCNVGDTLDDVEVCTQNCVSCSDPFTPTSLDDCVCNICKRCGPP